MVKNLKISLLYLFILILIIIIAFSFFNSCPNGLELVDGNCVIPCNRNEIRDSITKQCRKICYNNSVWSNKKQQCMPCDLGFKWNEDTENCIKFCDNCSNNGTCNITTQTCSCKPGFTEPDCSKAIPCFNLNNCSNNGICNNDKCDCYFGFKGPDCSQIDESTSTTNIVPYIVWSIMGLLFFFGIYILIKKYWKKKYYYFFNK
jgi:hypothetical protein